MASSSSTALKTFSLENDILEVSADDEIFKYDPEESREALRLQPWKKEYAFHLLTVVLFLFQLTISFSSILSNYTVLNISRNARYRLSH